VDPMPFDLGYFGILFTEESRYPFWDVNVFVVFAYRNFWECDTIRVLKYIEEQGILGWVAHKRPLWGVSMEALKLFVKTHMF